MPLAMSHLMLWIDHAGEVIRPTHGWKMIRHSKNSTRLCCIVFTHSFETWSMAHVTHNHGHQPIVLQIQNELEKSSSYRNFRIYAPQPHENYSMFVHSSLPQLNKLLSVYQLAVFLCLELCFGALCPALHFNCCTTLHLHCTKWFCSVELWPSLPSGNQLVSAGKHCDYHLSCELIGWMTELCGIVIWLWKRDFTM